MLILLIVNVVSVNNYQNFAEKMTIFAHIFFRFLRELAEKLTKLYLDIERLICYIDLAEKWLRFC